MKRPYKIPAWFLELMKFYENGTKHFFVFHYNVFDYIFPEPQPGKNQEEIRSLKEFIKKELMEYLSEPFSGVLFYSETAGFSTIDKISYDFFSKLLGEENVVQEGVLEEFKGKDKRIPTVEQAFSIIDNLLMHYNETEKRKIALVFDYLEHIAPSGSKEGIHESKMINIQMLRRIANNPYIALAKNIVIGITDNIDGVDDELRKEFGMRMIEIPFPDEEMRKNYLEYLKTRSEKSYTHLAKINDELGKEEKEKISNLKKHTHGFSLRALDEFNRLMRQKEIIEGEKFEGIKYSDIRDKRREILKKESKDLLIEMEPRGGFEAIGGLEHITNYLKTIVENIKRDKIASVPLSILLAGPPGTGKTIIAEALSKESGMNMVKFGDIRSKWVGESEKNLSKVFRLLKDMHPVIVFIDEIDQAFGSRGTGLAGDSGVSSRIFGKLLEEIGNTKNRGKVIWIAASNRVDLLDLAMIRRFGKIFPVLLPYSKEARIKIFRAMEKGIIENMNYSSDVNFDEHAERTRGLSGSNIEQILRNAVFIEETEQTLQYTNDNKIILTNDSIKKAIDRYKSNQKELEYKLQSLLAIEACNDIQDLPSEDEVPDDWAPILKRLKSEKNNTSLINEINTLKRQLNIE